MQTQQVVQSIEATILELIGQLVDEKESGLSLQVQDHDETVPDLKPSQRRKIDFFSARSTTVFLSSVHTMSLIMQLCVQNRFSTKRDIYYCNKPILKTQQQSNDVLSSLARMWGLNRNDLHIVCQPKGEVFGNIVFRQCELADWGNPNAKINTVDARAFSNMLPPIPHLQISSFEIPHDLHSIVIIEKESVFQQLKELWKGKNVILLTGKGYPDAPTRDFIVTLVKYVAEVQHRAMNIYIFTDGDPHGAEIANVYINGSKTMRNEKKTLTLANSITEGVNSIWIWESCARMKWIGVHLDEFMVGPNQSDPLFENCLMPLDNTDVGKVQSLLNGAVELDPMVENQIKLMLEFNRKVEIEALASVRVGYDDYLRAKILI